MNLMLVPRLAAFLACAGIVSAAHAEAETATRPIDVALVLAIDVSRSISFDEQRLQLAGYAAAFRDRAVQAAATSGVHGAIAVTVLEWANKSSTEAAIPWMLIDGEESAGAFASAIEMRPYRPYPGTSIATAIAGGHYLLDAVPYEATRRVIDVSGDGEGIISSLDFARERAIAAGISINGLPICDETPCVELPGFYDRRVIGGPGAFIVVAESMENFAAAIRSKLIVEIADLNGSMPVHRAVRQTPMRAVTRLASR